MLAGNGMLLLAALSWGMGIVHVRRHRWVSGPLDLAPWQMLLAAALLSAFAALREGPLTVQWGYEPVVILLFTGTVATAFCYWGAVVVSRKLPAMTSSLGFLGVPIVGIAASSVALAEPLSGTLLTGMTLILLGISTLIMMERDHRVRTSRLPVAAAG